MSPSPQHVHVVAEQIEARLAIARGEPLPGQRHPHAGGDALAQRAGRHLDPRRFAVFRMPGAGAAQLAEIADVVQRDGRLVQDLAVFDFPNAGQVQHRVQQHGSVAAGQNKSVSGRPPGVFRVVPHLMVPDRIGHRRQRHRGPRMAAVGLLDRVHRQGADRVDCQLLEVVFLCGHDRHFL